MPTAVQVLPDDLALLKALISLDHISAFYNIKRGIIGRPADVRLSACQRHSAPKVASFFGWSERQLTLILGKGELAKAVRYGLSRRGAFSLFLSDGRVPIDSPAERALPPICLGRNIRLFAGAGIGAETHEINQLDLPWKWSVG